MDEFATLKILVVDDESIIGMLIEDILADAGCRAIEVRNSLTEATSYLATNTPDFVILDINLAGQKSYPLADSLRAAGTPFIFLSGYGSRGVDPAYADCLALPKPFKHDDLLAAVRAAIGATA